MLTHAKTDVDHQRVLASFPASMTINRRCRIGTPLVVPSAAGSGDVREAAVMGVGVVAAIAAAVLVVFVVPSPP